MITYFTPLLALASSYNVIAPVNVALLTPKEVDEKLDTIIVFTPFDKGEPKHFSFDVEGKKKKVYFAAFSVSATQYLSNNVITTSKNSSDKFTYSPKSLSKFFSLINAEKEKGEKVEVIYIPDPEQKDISKKLLTKQGYKIEDMNNFLANNPIIFCPNPTISATDKNSNTFIPCSTDYKNLKLMVDKAEVKKKFPWSKVDRPEVMAIPLGQFINTLNTSEEENVKQIRVLPTPSTIDIINKMNKQNKNN
tara:strand:+ start:1489 stop:2235 length:747 start_codon:yes stop_codon:yes gene_type:complete